MAGSTGSGYTHFKKVSGVDGVYKGAAGSEISLSDGNQIFTANLAGGTAADAAYIVVPYACKLVAGYIDIRSGAVGTGVTVTTFNNDTAGTALFGSVSIASAGTAGSVTYTMGTMSTATLAAGSSIAIIEASSATACGLSVTIVATKAS